MNFKFVVKLTDLINNLSQYLEYVANLAKTILVAAISLHRETEGRYIEHINIEEVSKTVSEILATDSL